MKTIILATKNRNKVIEITNIMKDVTFSYPENMPVVHENGKTLKENAVHKAETISNYTGKMALADDSGLEVESLHGLPGVKSARFAGENASYADNNKKLLKMMEGILKRDACFRCIVALAGPSRKTITEEGICKGYICENTSGENGFGYDPIFVPQGYDKTFAELSPSVKNSISHRAKALEKMHYLILEGDYSGKLD